MTSTTAQELIKLSVENEKTIQNLIEFNIESILGLEFVASELRIQNERRKWYRFDTIGFNKSKNTFVVVEYKKGQSLGLLEQGKAYLNTIRKRKAEFIKKINKTSSKQFELDKINWKNMYVVYITSDYSNYQIDVRDEHTELWKYQIFDNNNLFIERIYSSEDKEDNVIQKLFSLGKSKRIQTVIPKPNFKFRPNEMVNQMLVAILHKFDNLYLHINYDHYYLTYGSLDGYEACTLFNLKEGGVRIRIYRGRKFPDRKTKHFVYIKDVAKYIEKTYRWAPKLKLHYCFYQYKISDIKDFSKGLKLIEQRISMLK